MTIQQSTTTEGRMPVPQLMATLLLLLAEHKLPDPIDMEAVLWNGCADLKVTSRSELEAWRAAIDADREIKVWAQTLGGTDYDIHQFALRRWGWFITFGAHVPVGTVESVSLPASTLAVLAEVAAR